MLVKHITDVPFWEVGSDLHRLTRFKSCFTNGHHTIRKTYLQVFTLGPCPVPDLRWKVSAWFPTPILLHVHMDLESDSVVYMNTWILINSLTLQILAGVFLLYLYTIFPYLVLVRSCWGPKYNSSLRWHYHLKLRSLLYVCMPWCINTYFHAFTGLIA